MTRSDRVFAVLCVLGLLGALVVVMLAYGPQP